MFGKNSERGQAIILIVFSIIGIIGLTALTVDGGVAYSDRRQAQGAADTAAWAGALANARGESVAGIEAAALEVAAQNGYANDGIRSDVTVEVIDDPSGECPANATTPSRQITVRIDSYVDTFFAPVIGVEQVTNRVVAVTRACGTFQDGIFGGQAIFSLGYGVGVNDCAFDSGQGGAEWDVICSGIFSNTCAYAKNNKSVEFFDANGNPTTDLCVAAVGGAKGALSGKACPGSAPTTYDLAYAQSIMPPNPCTGPVVNGVYQGDSNGPGGGLVPPAFPKNGYVKLSPDAQGRSVYCITNPAAMKDTDVELDYVTLYMTPESFELKYAGANGSIFGTPTQSGTYSSYSVIVPLPKNPSNFCTSTNDKSGPNIDYRGNGQGILYGTFLAPSACVTMLGNAGSGQGQSGVLRVNGQFITNMTYSNGTANIIIDYCKDQHRREPVPPNIILVR